MKIRKTPKIKFISYTGDYPNLCNGCLTVEIDGEIVKFGHDACSYQISTDSFIDDPDNTHYDEFWSSGGCVVFDDEWNDIVTSGEWKLQ